MTHDNVSGREEMMKGEIVCEFVKRGKMFPSRTLLKRRAVAHSKEHPCQCDICHKNVKWLCELRVH
jgi:hypothetical protein